MPDRSSLNGVAFILAGLLPSWSGAGYPEQTDKLMKPGQVKRIPRAIASALESAQCLIPQATSGPRRSNFVSGRFAAARQTDYAVLCSIHGTKSIVMVWGGPARCAVATEEARASRYGTPILVDGVERRPTIPDAPSLPAHTGVVHSGIPDTGDIDRITQKGIDRFRGPDEPPLIDRSHDGLDVGTYDSTIWYCTRGEWLMRPGMD